tara:strand:+ start:4559 stop:6160 length:1602 start_codon:yes stop_codon:yes gene_type:complete
MGREVKFGSEARSELQSGLDVLANAVKVTLGPKGRHAAIEVGYGAPLITKDGVTVAKSIALDDKVMNMGAQLIKTVAATTNNIAGDGTTTATVLAQAIYTEGAKMVAAGHNPVLIKRGIDIATNAVVDSLRDMSIPITNSETVRNVAKISSNNDSELGDIIGEAISAIGSDGIISVEEATGMKTSVEYTDGIKIDRGFVSSGFVTNLDKMTCDFENPLIFTYDSKVLSSYEVIPLLKEASQAGLPLVIIAKDFSPEVLETMLLNKARGAVSCCAVKSPGFGDISSDMLADISSMCGTTLFNSSNCSSIGDVNISDLGRARKFVAARNETTIIDAAGDQSSVEDRVQSLKDQLNQGDLFDWQIASIRERLSVLSGGVAVFKVGGATEAEMKERKDRVEDSINAVKAAIDEGIVPGGGTALLHCVNNLNEILSNPDLSSEERIGVEIISNAIKAPFFQILKNSGVDHYRYMEKIISDETNKNGFNALKNCFVEDMVEEGIIDPTKVVRTALENAASASGTLLTTEVAIFAPHKKE